MVVVIVGRRRACNWCSYVPSHLTCGACGSLVGVVVVVGVGVIILFVVVGVGAVVIVAVVVVIVGTVVGNQSDEPPLNRKGFVVDVVVNLCVGVVVGVAVDFFC